MQPFDRLKKETEENQGYLYAAPILDDVAAGRFDLNTYTGFLRNAYHHVRHTVPLMMACGSRLPERLRWMQDSIKEYILEEFGHEQWILEDLEACGVDSTEVVNSQPNFETELLVSYVYDYVARVNPVGFFGMVHVLEGTSTAIATETARLAQEKLGLPDNAFHYLRSHGELDQEHVVFFENLINQLVDPEDLDALIHVANRVFRLYGDVIQSASGGAIRHAA